MQLTPAAACSGPQVVRIDDAQLDGPRLQRCRQVLPVKLPPVRPRLWDGQNVPAAGHGIMKPALSATFRAHPRGRGAKKGCAGCRAALLPLADITTLSLVQCSCANTHGTLLGHLSLHAAPQETPLSRQKLQRQTINNAHRCLASRFTSSTTCLSRSSLSAPPSASLHRRLGVPAARHITCGSGGTRPGYR